MPVSKGADPRGNERLTAMTGTVLLVLFIVECLTLLNLGGYLTLHVFLGMLLLGPVSLKIGSTLWRFTRYYTGSEPYVRKGTPTPLQRVTRTACHPDHRGRPRHRRRPGHRGTSGLAVASAAP